MGAKGADSDLPTLALFIHVRLRRLVRYLGI